jgi:hypothetical protein
MAVQSILRSSFRWATAALGVAAGTYAGYVGMTWCRYGRPAHPKPEENDELLDRFMPVYDVVERHHIHVAARASVTLAVAREMDVLDVPLIRAVFQGRELILGSTPDTGQRPRGLLAEMESLGWVVLAEVPKREIVFGAVTRPWEANVTFRSVRAEEYGAFNESDYVKIVWTLRADPTGETSSVFRTETRAVATDASARTKFRRYWSFLSPGIILIRRMMLRPIKTEAERRAALFRATANG